MKTLLIMLASCAFLVADGNSDTTKATARVQVIAPVKVRCLGAIDFGTIVVDDYNKPAQVLMSFKGLFPDYTNNPGTELTFTHCAQFRNSAPHTPGRFQVERDALVAPSFAGYMSGVKMTCDTSVTLSGGHGGDVHLVVKTDLPAEDFVPANPVSGVLYSRFQVAGLLDIPAKCLGYKEGTFHVAVTYM